MDTTTTTQSETPDAAVGKCLIVHNRYFGGAAKLSDLGMALYNRLRIIKNLPVIDDPCLDNTNMSITDPDLVETVRSLGDLASTSSLIIEYIPAEYEHCFHIREFDGSETVKYDTPDLIAYTLKSYDPDLHSDKDNIVLLKKMVDLAKNPINPNIKRWYSI